MTTTMPRRRQRQSSVSGWAAVGALVLLPIHAVISGLVVRYLYHRLMVPTFPGLPHHLSIAAALGLAIFVGYLTSDEPSAAHDQRSFGEREISYLVVRGLTVLMALVVGAFM